MIREKAPERSANIFINYRREDSAGHSGRLFDRLSNRFPGRVFMDIDTIEPGVDFAEVIERAVGCCEILIVVIGREWLNVTDATGRRRLDSPKDFVRLEVAAALERNIRVIPVLVEGATMPQPEDLPPDLAKLARRNAIELSDARWAFDVDRLIQTIEKVLQEKEAPAPAPAPPAPSRPAREMAKSRVWMALAAVVVVLALAGWIGWRSMKPPALQKAEEVASSESPVTPAALPETSPAAAETPSQPAEPEPQPIEEETNSAPEEPVEEVPAPQPEEPELAYGPDTCKKGFVWREARPEDHVCVTPQVRDQTAEDNRQADARRDPAGPYGPNTCISGYVWREAFEGDVVCVTPETRDQARLDNSQEAVRRMLSIVRLGKSLFKGKDKG